MNTRVPVLVLLLVLLFPACQTEESDRVFDTADEYVRYGNLYLRNRNFEAAIKQYSLALDLDSYHYDALIGLGDASSFRAKLLLEASDVDQNQTNQQRPNAQVQRNPGGDIVQETTQDMSVNERVNMLIKQAALAYGRARYERPESALPYLKYGRLIYQFRERSPENIKKSIRLLEKALERISSEKQPRTRAKILYFLGAAEVYQEDQKPEEARDYSEARTYFNRYLDVFDKRGAEAPRRAKIERFLMDIEENGGSENESGADS